jgi:RNA polymerase sigma factor (sigma-70 family)
VHAPAIDSALAARLYEQSRATEWAVPVERFEAALAASLAHARAAAAGGGIDAERYASALHLEDLALALACAAGHDGAWQHFIAHHRPLLQRAAAAIDPAGGAELADTIWAELFEKSLFRYFHGRSKLSTWLRAVLAQRHIDRIRTARRLEPLPDDGAHLPAPDSEAPDPERVRFVQVMRDALSAAVAALSSQDRLRLGLYYARDMKLAAIGKLLGEHEATVSRQLARTRREIRAATEDCLKRKHGLDDRAVSECFQSVAADAGELDLADLLGTSGARKNAAADRSTK